MIARRGFTLVELMVVVAVIAMIVALLLPAVKLVRESALLAKCMSNQRQLLLGLQSYAVDHGDYPFYWFEGSTCNPSLYKAGYTVSRDSTSGSSMHQWVLPMLEQEEYLNQAVGFCANRARLQPPLSARMDQDWGRSPANPDRWTNWNDSPKAFGNKGDFIYRGPGTHQVFWSWTRGVKERFPEIHHSSNGRRWTIGVNIRNQSYRIENVVSYTVKFDRPAAFSGKTQPLIGCPLIWSVPNNNPTRTLHHNKQAPIGYTDGHVEIDRL